MTSTYYTTENGKITQSADWPFPGAIETDKEIVRGYDGALYFAGEEPVYNGLTSDEMKAQFNAAIEVRLNAFARERGWETIDRVLAQRGEFASDAPIAQDAYDKTWAAALALYPQIEAGTLAIEAALEQLPPISWQALA